MEQKISELFVVIKVLEYTLIEHGIAIPEKVQKMIKDL